MLTSLLEEAVPNPTRVTIATPYGMCYNFLKYFLIC